MATIEGSGGEIEQNYIKRLLFWMMFDTVNDLKGKRFNQEKKEVMACGFSQKEVNSFVSKAMASVQYTQFVNSMMVIGRNR